jgi:lipid A 3-O-deacylase
MKTSLAHWRQASTIATLAAVVTVLAAPLAANAQSSSGLVQELRLGVLVHDMPGLWSGFRLERGADINAEVILAPSIPMLGGNLRPAIGASLSTSGQTSKAYLDARWMVEARSGFFLGLGLGAAVHNGVLDATEVDRKALGSRVLFHIPLEIGYRFDGRNSLSLYFDHMSNGYTQKYNEGLDSLGVRYGYKF